MPTPAYRARIFQPDSLGVPAVLTPAAGAPHAAAFQVSTVSGVAGYEPLLDPGLTRAVKLDPVTKRYEVGEVSLLILDRRTGIANNERWATAFAGDANGISQFLGAAVEIDISPTGNPAGPWTRFYTGRTTDAALDGRLALSLTVRDRATDFNDLAFVGRPAGAVSYAAAAQLWPLGSPFVNRASPLFPDAGRIVEGIWESFVNLRGQILPVAANAANLSRAQRRSQALSKGLVSKGSRNGSRISFVQPDEDSPVWCELRFGAGFAEVSYARVLWIDTVRLRPENIEVPSQIAIVSQRDVGFVSLPGLGEPYRLRLVAGRDGYPTKDAPVVVDRVHPLVLVRDLLRGRFGRLDAFGNPLRSVPFNATAFSDAIGETGSAPWDVPLVRYVIDKPKKLFDFIEDDILGPLHLGYRFNAAGEFEPIDLRRRPSIASAPVIGSSALSAGSVPQWRERADAAFERITVEAPSDTRVTLDDAIARAQANAGVYDGRAILLDEDPEPFLFVSVSNARGTDIARRTASLTADGFRTGLPGDLDPSVWGQRYADEVRQLFGFGETSVTLELNADDPAVGSALPGDWRRVNVDELPNRATNRRGGERIFLVAGRDDVPGAVVLSLVDGGPAQVAGTPALGTPAVSAGMLTVPVTLSATDPAELKVAVVAVGAAAPNVDAPGVWTPLATVSASGTVTATAAPVRGRVYFAARTAPVRSVAGLRLASAWVVSAGLDVTGNVLTGLANAAGFFPPYDRRLTWSIVDASFPLRVSVRRTADAEPFYSELFPAGSTRVDFPRIFSASTQYTARVEPEGALGVGLAAETTWTSGADQTYTPTGVPPAISALLPASTFPQPGDLVGVSLVIAPANGAQDVVLQRAPDAGGVPGTWSTLRILPPDTAGYIDELPNDGALRWYRAGQGNAFSLGVSASPGAIRSTPGNGIGATGLPMPVLYVGTEQYFRDADGYAPASDATADVTAPVAFTAGRIPVATGARVLGDSLIEQTGNRLRAGVAGVFALLAQIATSASSGLPANRVMLGADSAHEVAILADPASGGAGGRVGFWYFNGASWYPAARVSNVTGGGGVRGVLELLPDGGRAVIGADPGGASTDALRITGDVRVSGIIYATDFVLGALSGGGGGGGGGGSPVAVLDEGVSLTTAAASLNFVGAGVTATAAGAAITVTIPGGGGGGVTGSGTTNVVPRWTGAAALGDSGITDDGATITLGRQATTPSTLSFSTNNLGARFLRTSGLWAIQRGDAVAADSLEIFLSDGSNTGEVVFYGSAGATANVRLFDGSLLFGTAAQSAALGTVRMPSGASIRNRNAAGTADVWLVGTDGANNVVVGSGAPVLVGGTLAVTGLASLNAGATFGANSAASGTLRVPNQATLTFRNAANNDDIEAIRVNASNVLAIVGQSVQRPASIQVGTTLTDSGTEFVRFRESVRFRGAVTFDVAPSGVSSGSGTTNRIARFTAATTLGDSGVSDDGAEVFVIAGRTFRTAGNATIGGNLVLNNPSGAMRARNTAGADANDDFGLYRSAGTWRLAGWITGLGVRIDTATGDFAVDRNLSVPAGRAYVALGGSAYDPNAGAHGFVRRVAGEGTVAFFANDSTVTRRTGLFVNVNSDASPSVVRLYASGDFAAEFGFFTGNTEALTITTAATTFARSRLAVGTLNDGWRLHVAEPSAATADIFLAGMVGVTNGLTLRRVAGGAFELDLATGRLRLRQFGDPVSSARLSVIGSGASGEGVFGSAIEWGHPNAGGYRSTLGAFNTGGQGFVALHAEHGTNDNTLRTRGIAGVAMVANLTGGVEWRTLAANADNQAGSVRLELTASGTLTTFGPVNGHNVAGRDGAGFAAFYRDASLNRLWDSAYGDTITWGAAGRVNLPEGGLNLAGVRSVARGSSYLFLYDPTDRVGIYVGGADPANYYDNTNHFFRSRTAGAATSIWVGGGVGGETGIKLANEDNTYLTITNGRTSQSAAGAVIRSPITNALYGYFYGDAGGGVGTGQIGFLPSDGGWAVRVNNSLVDVSRPLVVSSAAGLLFGSLSGPAMTLNASGTSARVSVYGGSGDSGFSFRDATNANVFGWVLGYADIVGVRIFPANGSRPLQVRNDDIVEYDGGYLFVNPKVGSTRDAAISARGHNLAGNAYVEATTVSGAWAFFRVGNVEGNAYWDIAHRITGGHGDSRLGFRWQGGGPQVWFTTAGNVHAADFVLTSDRKIKTALRPITGALDMVDRVGGWRYTNLLTGADELGVVAQDVEAAGAGEAVALDGDTLGVKYDRLAPIAFAAIRELRAEVREFVAALSAENARLRAQLAERGA